MQSLAFCHDRPEVTAAEQKKAKMACAKARQKGTLTVEKTTVRGDGVGAIH